MRRDVSNLALPFPRRTSDGNEDLLDLHTETSEEDMDAIFTPKNRIWVGQRIFNFQGLTGLELGFCDDGILELIGERLWNLKHLTLHLSHFCSDCGLIKLMHTKLPKCLRKMNLLSNELVSLSVKPGSRKHRTARQQNRFEGALLRHFNEELNNLVPIDPIHGCRFLERLILVGNIKCFGITETEDEHQGAIFSYGLHLLYSNLRNLRELHVIGLDEWMRPGNDDDDLEALDAEPLHLLVLKDMRKLRLQARSVAASVYYPMFGCIQPFKPMFIRKVSLDQKVCEKGLFFLMVKILPCFSELILPKDKGVKKFAADLKGIPDRIIFRRCANDVLIKSKESAITFRLSTYSWSVEKVLCDLEMEPESGFSTEDESDTAHFSKCGDAKMGIEEVRRTIAHFSNQVED